MLRKLAKSGGKNMSFRRLFPMQGVVGCLLGSTANPIITECIQIQSGATNREGVHDFTDFLYIFHALFIDRRFFKTFSLTVYCLTTQRYSNNYYYFFHSNKANGNQIGVR